MRPNIKKETFNTCEHWELVEGSTHTAAQHIVTEYEML